MWPLTQAILSPLVRELCPRADCANRMTADQADQGAGRHAGGKLRANSRVTRVPTMWDRLSRRIPMWWWWIWIPTRSVPWKWSRAYAGQSRSLTVMVYSAHPDPELLVRCMRAGAREFLTDPVLPNFRR